MATVGYTNIGASTYSAGTTSGGVNPAGLLITFPTAGIVSKITAYVATTVSSQSISCRIYSGSAGSLGTLIATTATSTVTTSFGFVDFTFAIPLNVTATTYWIEFIGFGGGGPGTAVGQIKFDTGGATNSGYAKSDLQVPAYNTSQYSIYATYTLPPPANFFFGA